MRASRALKVEFYSNCRVLSRGPATSDLCFDFILFFGLCWVFIAAGGLPLAAASGGYSSLRCAGFSLQWLLLLWSTGSRCAGFSSCGTWAQ